ncbi:HECT-domain protein [Necator americanus]|uniref:HECT-domain protein n=1 Tax=Necator americanus TaxID=51031 RepID=W2TX07_NECAM|nr:HECT-domain protein [Necator americanus]ETN85557.1 HECT-domain protein [Necator americanus]
MWSVGGNEDGQLGRGGRGPGSFTIYPVSFSGGVKMLQIAAGRSHSLSVAEDGRLFAWGSNEHGQLAMPRHISWQETPNSIFRRVGELTEVVQVACGPLHCIALLESGAVAVWGEQADGAILHSPQIVSQLIGVPIVRVIAGGRHCVAISAGGGVYVWGQNDYGQLGTGDTLPRSTPFFLEGMSAMHIIEAFCGDSHTLLLSQEGRLFAFGSDAHGQIGGGRKFDKHTNPAAITELMGSTVTRVACGRNHSVVVIGGRLYPFGQNANGQLGNGSAVNQLIPRQTEELDHVVAVFAGFDQTFILRSVGTHVLNAGPNAPLKVPLYLRKEDVLSLLSRHEKLDLIGLLESVFSSISCINGSFLYEDERRFLSEGRVFGVNLDDVMDTFSALGESSDARQYAELIIETCQISVFGEDFNPSVMCSVESLRIYLILVWMHAFATNVTRDVVSRLHLPFAQSVSRLRPAFRNALEKWWVVLPVRHFNRLATAMLAAVRCLVKDKVSPGECRDFLDILATLCAINKVTNKIPLENFYIHELAENYNLKMDYVNWAHAQEGRAASATCWSNYPFIMNAAAKGELLYVEAVMSMQVQFMSEEAEDAGGVKKEFFMILFQKLLQSECVKSLSNDVWNIFSYGMFVEDPDSHLVWFSGYDVEEINYYKMVGILCGLAVYNCVLVAFPFPLALYKILLDQQPVLEDLTELSPVEGRSLQELLDYQGDDIEDVFCLNFTISYAAFGSTETFDLKPGGAEISVTQSNKADYVQKYVHHRLCVGRNGEVGRQAAAFRDGFKLVLNSRIVAFFQPRELMELVVGNENYDWSELRKGGSEVEQQCASPRTGSLSARMRSTQNRNERLEMTATGAGSIVQYKGEYHAKHPAILAFWEAFFELNVDERKQFLQFLMGSTRLPVGGMTSLRMYIQPSAPEVLPVAHTCFNLLDLPNITDSKEIKLAMWKD